MLTGFDSTKSMKRSISALSSSRKAFLSYSDGLSLGLTQCLQALISPFHLDFTNYIYYIEEIELLCFYNFSDSEIGLQPTRSDDLANQNFFLFFYIFSTLIDLPKPFNAFFLFLCSSPSSSCQNCQYLNINMNYSRINDDPQGKTFTDFARHMKEMIIEDKQKDIDSSQLYSGRYKRPLFMVNDMESTFLTMDKSLLYVGDNSTFQKRITWILAIQWISFSFMVNSMAYFFRSPNFTCRVPLTDIFYGCSQTTACRLGEENYQINTSLSPLSIVEEYGLYCSESGLIYWAQTFFFLGGFFSGYILSYISQRIGRRPVILFVLILSIISMTLCAWAPTFNIFVISYFFTGFFLFGYETTVYIYISEISAVRFKTISVNMLTMVWAGTPMFLVVLRFIPSWRYSFFLFAMIWLVTLPFAYFCILESPRFLLNKKCYTQVRQIFHKISITNRRPPYKFKLIQEMDVENEQFLRFKGDDRENSKQTQLHEVKQYNYFDLFRYGSVKKATLFLIYMWMYRFLMYFALNLALESVLQSGMILTLAISISSFFEVIGTFGILIITFSFKRKFTLLEIIKYCTLLLSILCAGLWLIQINNQCKVFEEFTGFCLQVLIMIFLISLIKFVNSIFFSALIPYSSEIYPTVVKSLGYGFTLSCGRMGTFIVPFYINVMRAHYENINSLCFFAPFGLIGFILCSLMPSVVSPNRDGIPQQQEESKFNREFRDIELNIIGNHMPLLNNQPAKPSPQK